MSAPRRWEIGTYKGVLMQCVKVGLRWDEWAKNHTGAFVTMACVQTTDTPQTLRDWWVPVEELAEGWEPLLGRGSAG